MGESIVSVIIPDNPFNIKIQNASHCVCALDVDNLMEWWPGAPHKPLRDPLKVKTIQRSLDWSRVAHIGSYLLQQEIVDAPKELKKCFDPIYNPQRNDPGREWPPKVSKTISFESSVYPGFSNIIIHVNGAKLIPDKKKPKSGFLALNDDHKDFSLSVIDGQHRINGAYFALHILRKNETDKQKAKKFKMQIPALVFLNLDPAGEPPKNQAQVFIDVNYYQKKVDKSLVVDLFPTVRLGKDLSERARAQDIARRLMLETGPLIGMIQIPGIKYGVKGVIALATLAGAIEEILPYLKKSDLNDINSQTEFLAVVLEAWLKATGRFVDPREVDEIDSKNVVYQGRILVSALALTPAILKFVSEKKIKVISAESKSELTNWCLKLLENSKLLEKGKFVSREVFTEKGYLGSGGIGRFRDLLWASLNKKFDSKKSTDSEYVNKIAESVRGEVEFFFPKEKEEID